MTYGSESSIMGVGNIQGMQLIRIGGTIVQEESSMNKLGLSKREEQVARMLMEGKSNKLIAITLGISEGTVEFHLTSIYSKLEVSSRTEAIVRLGQLGFSLDTSKPSNLGKTPGEETGKHGETPDEIFEENLYDENEQRLFVKANPMDRKKSSPSRNYTVPIILGIVCVLIAVAAVVYFLSMPKKWQGFARECEYPDTNSVGTNIARSNASEDMALGQFGTTDAEPWPAKEGTAVYRNITTPLVEQLYIKLRYSKNSAPSIPILVFLDDEITPRASIYLENQKDWNQFAWTAPILLGKVESGVHTITFSTVGEQYGVADLDKFILSAGSP